MDTVKVQTTQNIAIEYPLASIGDRILATLIDSLVIFTYIMIILFFIMILLGALESQLDEDDMWYFMALFIVLYIPAFLYHLLCEQFFQGQSVGKRVMNIKVVKTDGSSASFGSYLLRWMLRMVDFTLTYYSAAAISILVTEKSQRLGDLAAGTTVVKLKQKTTIKDTIFRDINEVDYDVQYPEVEQLTDQDIQIITEVLQTARKTNNAEMVMSLAVKMEEVLNVSAKEKAYPFLNTLVKDYNYLTSGKI